MLVGMVSLVGLWCARAIEEGARDISTPQGGPAPS